MQALWHRLELEIPQHAVDEISTDCFEAGSCGLETLDDGDMCRLTAFFAADVDIEEASRALDESLNSVGLGGATIRRSVEEERDWSSEWRRFSRPVWASSRIVVHPSWIPVDTTADQIAIVIDPEMAFGTGAHESTQLCLQAMDELSLEGSNCLDIGTGSGVLAIAAALMGAEVVAVDVDRQAVEIARHNIEANLRPQSAADRVDVRGGSVEVVAGRVFDFVFANLEARMLLPLLGAIRDLMRTGGVVLFSGLLHSDGGAFRQAFERAGLDSVRAYARNDWVCYAARRSRSRERRC